MKQITKINPDSGPNEDYRVVNQAESDIYIWDQLYLSTVGFIFNGIPLKLYDEKLDGGTVLDSIRVNVKGGRALFNWDGYAYSWDPSSPKSSILSSTNYGSTSLGKMLRPNGTAYRDGQYNFSITFSTYDNWIGIGYYSASTPVLSSYCIINLLPENANPQIERYCFDVYSLNILHSHPEGTREYIINDPRLIPGSPYDLYSVTDSFIKNGYGKDEESGEYFGRVVQPYTYSPNQCIFTLNGILK